MQMRATNNPVKLPLVISTLAILTIGPRIAMATPEVSTTRVSHGSRAGACQWPATVAVQSRGGQLCSGTLIHPNVVLFASHCMRTHGQADTIQTIRFGEEQPRVGSAKGPGLSRTPTKCVAHPLGSGEIDSGIDWALCTFDEPIDSLPVVPIARGCELDDFKIGSKVTLAGFGRTQNSETDYGIKRYGESTIQRWDETRLLVHVGKVNACAGDSGSGLLIQLEDGSWRTVGIASTLGGTCGSGDNTYARLHDGAVAWIEKQSGYDVTPCFDGNTWAPTKECGNFLKGNSAPGSGTWGSSFANSCESTERINKSAACGPAHGDGDESADDAGPEITIKSPKPDAVLPAKEALRVKFRVKDDSEIKSITIQLDDQDAISLDTDAKEHRFKSLREGRHEIHLVATDIHNNENEENVKFRISAKGDASQDDSASQSNTKDENTNSSSQSDDSKSESSSDSNASSSDASTKDSSDSSESSAQDSDQDDPSIGCSLTRPSRGIAWFGCIVCAMVLGGRLHRFQSGRT